MSEIDKLIPLAKTVRQAFEKKYGETLFCFCYRVSVELFIAAKENGINNIKLAGNYNHVFCIIGDTVIDLTASQFGHSKKIAIGKVGKWPKNISYENHWRVEWSESDIEKAKIVSGWALDHAHENDRKLVLKEFEELQIQVSL